MSSLTIRPPQASEIPRALRFFSGEYVKSDAQVLVAVKMMPVERFLGALAGWAEGEVGRFHLECLPGSARKETAAALIQEAERTARTAGLRKLIYGKLLAKGAEPDDLLLENGFEILRSERFFKLDVSEVENRVGKLLGRHGPKIPATWRTEAIRHLSPDSVRELIAPFCLMTPEELSSCWQRGERSGFDPDLSRVLIENENVFGTFLGRRVGELFCVDVRVVNHPKSVLRALANLCLFHQSLVANSGLPNPVRWLQFRGGEQEHKETANLAMRMGGTELPPRYVWAKSL